MKMTQKKILEQILSENPGRWFAVHEIVPVARSRGFYMNENYAATCLCSDLKGIAEGRRREGKAYKEWKLVDSVEPKPLCQTQQ